MSCLMLKDETLSAIADFLACLLNRSYDYFGFTPPVPLYDALQRCMRRYDYQPDAIFDELYKMNFAAYRGRYGEEAGEIYDDAPEYRPNVQYKPSVYAPIDPADKGSDYSFQVLPWHYEMVKRLDCYLYQCVEDATSEMDLFKALIELRNDMCSWIVRHTTQYLTHRWGD